MDAAFVAVLSEPDVVFLCTLKEEQRPTLKDVFPLLLTGFGKLPLTPSFRLLPTIFCGLPDGYVK